MDTLEYGWLDNPVDLDESLEVPQFTLERYIPKDCAQNYTAGLANCFGQKSATKRMMNS